MNKHYKYLLILIFLGVLYPGFAQQPFTAGSFVVYRIGDGTTVLNNSAAKVYLDEYTADGVLLQSILMPTTTNGANSLLTSPGTDANGYINLSANGKYIVVPGTNIPVGVDELPTANVLGLVDFNGKINTSTVITDASENNRRSATAVTNDGTGIWFGGHRMLRYATVGSSTSVLITNPRNLLDLDIVNGQLYAYYSNAAFFPKVGTIGTGLPTTAGQVATDLPGLPSDILDHSQFSFVDLDPSIPGVDVLYLVDASTTVNPAKGIRKFSLVNGAWTANGAIGTDVVNGHYRGLTARVTGTTVTLFATRADRAGIAGQEIVKMIDNGGYNATITGTPAVIVTVATPNTMSFKGVALSPQPAPFTAGNIVVYRAGDGSAALDGTATRVYLDEYTVDGVLVQSILMPTATSGSNSLLTVNGGDATLGGLNLSADGKYLIVPGNNTALGSTANPTANVIGIVDPNGKANTSTVITDAPENARRSTTAISDNGTRIWFGGHRVLRYTMAGSSTSVLLATPRSLADFDISDGQLYASYVNSTFAGKAGAIGNGLPTTTGQVTADLPGLPANIVDAGQLAFADLEPTVAGVDVLYLTDGSFTASTTRGIRKFSLVNGLWVDNGAVGSEVANSFYRGLTIKVNGNTVSIFATKSNSAGTMGQELVKLVDNSGYNGTLTGTPSTIASVATPGTMAFRGVTRVPLGCLAVSGLRVPDISATAANIVWAPPANGGSNYEYAITTSSIPPASGTATTNTSANVQGLTNGVTYYAHVRTICSALSTSEWSTTPFVTGCKASPLPLINIIITDTGAVNIKWNKVFGALAYEYVISTSSVQPSTGTETSDTTIALNGLNSITQYYVHIRSKCSGGAFSPWVSKPFKTTCFMPSPQLVVLAKNLGVKWKKISNSVKYEYALTYNALPPLSGIFTTDTTYSIGQLNESTPYYFHVRSVCSNGTVSEWSMIHLEAQGLQAYPNPVKDNLQIQLNGVTNPSGQITIGDAMGRVIIRVKLTNSMATVNTRGWASGIYLVRYEDGKNKYSVRIVKQ